jgi:hypothetical protein
MKTRERAGESRRLAEAISAYHQSGADLVHWSLADTVNLN